MWYDKLPVEKQEEVKRIITHSRNPTRDPSITKAFLDLTMKHYAVFDSDGKYYRLGSNTKPVEHEEIRSVLKRTKAKKTLEVGFAYGTSAILFAEHHQKMGNTGLSHYVVDPNQFGEGSGHWNGIGAENLKRVGFIRNKNWKLIEESSTDALPELLRRNRGTFDVVFIDGMHLFDYTLIDIFYSLQLIRVGGVVIVDDKRMKAITAVQKYIEKSYKHITNICPSCPTMLVIKKTKEDDRDWNSDEFIY